jgi:hypothetical protein
MNRILTMAETGISIPVIASRLNLTYKEVCTSLIQQGKDLDYPTNAHIDTPEEVILWKHFAEDIDESLGMTAYRFGITLDHLHKVLFAHHSGDTLPSREDDDIQIFLTAKP